MSDFEILSRIAASAAMTDDEVDRARDARDYLEAEPGVLEGRRPDHIVPQLNDDEVRALVSEEAQAVILMFEVSSEAHYKKRYERPILPGVRSGITVGIGYDLGYHPPDTVRRDFGDLISTADIESLVRCCGLKGEAARSMLPAVQHVSVSLEVAKEVYRRSTVPRYGRMVLQAFPNAVELKGHCFGALLSLVYNRGNDLEGERRREMKAIRDLMMERQWREVPGQIRSMKRLWKDDPNAKGLLKRRDAEAALFERGLELLEQPAAMATLEGAAFEGASNQSLATLEGDGFSYVELDSTTATLERTDPNWKRVVWAEDASSPDYSHILDRALSGASFHFGPQELELLIEANAFQPSREHGRIVFALRGVELIQSYEKPEPSSPQENRERLTLREVRPDHQSFRCVIGVYDVERALVHGYTASTVPNPKAVASYVAGGSPANMMLTGCYRFEVGWHQQSKSDRKIPGCLIEAGRRKGVLRTRKDHTYDLTDIVDDTTPGDNVHPGKSEGPFPFSSWGCFVLKGSVTPVTGSDRANVTHTGEWALFRKALGLPDRGTGGHGRKLDVILLTGLDAVIATNARYHQQSFESDEFRRQLLRLRQGSSGPRVAALRRALGLAAGDAFTSEVARKLAELQREKTGAMHGVYAPWMDEKLGLGIFKGEQQVATLEANASRADVHTADSDRLAFELASELESSRGSRPLTEDARHEGLLATVVEHGSRALVMTGRVLMREAEQTLKAYVCEHDGAGKLANRDAIRRRIDAAAQTSRGALKHVLVVALRQTTFSYASYGLLERLVGFILDDVLLPRAGEAGRAVVGRIDGGIAALCARWSQRIATAYLGADSAAGDDRSAADERDEAPVDVVAAVTPEPAAATTAPAAHAPLPVSASEDAEAMRLLQLIEKAADGTAPDVAGVKNCMHRLRDHLRAGAALTPEQHRRLLDVLCDSRFMEQLAGAAGLNPYNLMADIEAELGKDKPDRATIELRVSKLCDLLADARLKLQPESVEKTILALRRRRFHDQIALLADRVLTREPSAPLLGRIGPHYARALIDNGKIVAGIETLYATIERGQMSAEQSSEAWGGLGRAHKQIYVNHVKSTSDAVALKDAMGQQLARAIDAYGKLYDPSSPGKNHWHGINLIALLKRAYADQIDVGGRHDADKLAKGIIEAVEPKIAGSIDPYDLATLAEAHLALGQIDRAAKYYAEFAAHEKVEPFALNAAIRQLQEVWRLEAGKDGADALLVGLKAALGQKEGGRIILSANERRSIARAKSVDHQEHFETRTRDGKFVPLDYLKRLVNTGAAVAAIKQRANGAGVHVAGAGETVGTGFLIDGAVFGLEQDRSYLLTNAHVIWDPSRGLGLENKALEPNAAEIVFEGDDEDKSVFTVAQIVWQSPSGLHDACLIELNRRIEAIKPLEIAPARTELMIHEGKDKRGTPLAVVGHPQGGALSLSFAGSLEEISARLLDKGPKGNSNDPIFLHYSVPTEPGNSGSPVLETGSWKVVGLHHAGFDETHGRARLGGKAGTHHANEGIWLESIRAAVTKELNGLPKKPKRGWF